MARPRKSTKKSSLLDSTSSYLDRIEAEVQSNQSRVSYILGILIVIVVGVLLFNYFNQNKAEVGPAQNTTSTTDVAPDKLPGSYTVKDGDTLFTIAEKYYNDGYKYPEIAKANNLINVDSIEVGQVITIPKLVTEASPSPAASEPSASPSTSPTTVVEPAPTSWGPAITGNTYTVVADDWLSKIAGRAYGDIMAYDKIAKANNISNPDLIEVGQVLTIPR